MSAISFKAILATTFLVAAMAGCSSAGYSTKSSLVVPKTIRTPANIPPEVVPYVPRYIEALQAKGFAVGKTNDPRALDLVFEFNGNPFNLRVSAGLWNQGIPVLTGSATNPGWGAAIARGAAVNSLADKSVNQFTTELESFASRVKIVPDAP
jgi:hypothetical protein